METYRYPHFSSQLSIVHIALFLDVRNAAALKARMVKASTMTGDEGEIEREAVNFAFIDARLITSRLHLQTAIHQALIAESQELLRTKTLHSEILWALNPTNNISEAIRRYGVSESTNALFAVRVASPDLKYIESRMSAVVDGTISSLDALEGLTDWASVKKYHRLNAEPAGKEAVGDLVRERAILDKIVVSSVAMKSVSA